MEEGCCPLYMGSRRCPSETEGEGGALFTFYDMFFLLYNQTTLQIAKLPFKWLNCPYLLRLTSIREVTCVTHGMLFVSVKRGQSVAFLKMVAGEERLHPGIISPARLRKYVWTRLVNEDD